MLNIHFINAQMRMVPCSKYCEFISSKLYNWYRVIHHYCVNLMLSFINMWCFILFVKQNILT